MPHIFIVCIVSEWVSMHVCVCVCVCVRMCTMVQLCTHANIIQDSVVNYVQTMYVHSFKDLKFLEIVTCSAGIHTWSWFSLILFLIFHMCNN